ncbi:hypothetical protein C922_05164 [Plasmodium inui San Antonio 1]|uniref:Uncharacterized protein n=1 Tax=Plasmodium inui San Antonio 1 TaxID=1237626 RepID=W6ZYT6_9APIC|nr:hypothetical protein C922_05164 [Plasmodium inui San Antonio 1]EUD64450.1 hypothetical protein C922_05164 [Plasmodium inui San Antonio 1]
MRGDLEKKAANGADLQIKNKTEAKLFQYAIRTEGDTQRPAQKEKDQFGINRSKSRQTGTQRHIESSEFPRYEKESKETEEKDKLAQNADTRCPREEENRNISSSIRTN